MKVLMINVVCGIRSTGRICTDLATALEVQGHEVKIAYGREEVPEQFQKYAVRIGTDLDVKIHGAKARLFDACGFGSKRVTERFIEWIKDYNPDVIHLHNLHGYYINIEVLFDYLRNCRKRIIWTLHDCWAFTGHAAFCEAANCDRWTEGCYACCNKSHYPTSIIDGSKRNWIRKKNLFSNIPNLTIITPSRWLSNLVGKSFLCEYPTKVIHNGVDLSVFRKRESDIKKRLGLENQKIVLGVAALWEDRKGLSDLIALADIMDDRWKIVIVGVSDRQKEGLPRNIITVNRTNSPVELAELYSAADVYVNPTYEDNYPTTNIEAIACGTPVITYQTGGSGESAELFGNVVSKGDYKAFKHIIEAERLPSFFGDINELGKDHFCKHYIEQIMSNG